MSLIFKLARRGLVPPLSRHRQDTGKFLNYARSITMKCTNAAAPKDETHDEKNMRLGRPQSPHLTIYKPQLTTLLSISHRATGIVLTGHVVLFSMAALWLPCPIETYIEELRCLELGFAPIYALKFFIVFPLTYHYFNGIRHLIWDTGRCLTIKEVYITGWAMLVLAISTAAVVSGMTFSDF